MYYQDCCLGYMVRHGETELNASNCYRGWTDPSLNEDGLTAAYNAANFLSYDRIGQITSSDLCRAMETANIIISDNTPASPYVSPDPRLRPWNIGHLAGQKKTKANEAKLDHYISHPDIRIPEGESLTEFRARNAVVLELFANGYDSLPVIVVAHTSNIVGLHHLLDPESVYSEEQKDVVEPGGIVGVYMKSDGIMYLEPRVGAIASEGVVS